MPGSTRTESMLKGSSSNLELLGGISFCDADSGEAGVVDNNVQTAIPIESGVNRTLHGRLLSYVQLEHTSRYTETSPHISDHDVTC